MTKELTPLEALKEIAKCSTWGDYTNYSEYYKIIETALKDYEKKTKLAKEYADVDNVAKRLKALEIIKNKVQKIKWIGFEYKDGTDIYSIDWRETPTKEESDLLEEVLK